MQSPSENYRRSLKQAGLVLLVIGLVDMGVMAYFVVHKRSYSSGLNLFAVIAGLLLWRGSLKTASLVRWSAVFTLSGAISLALLYPWLEPPALTYTRLRIEPGAALGTLAFTMATLVLSAWLAHTLGAPAVTAAHREAGRPLQKLRAPIALGIALSVVLAGAFMALQQTDAAVRALHEAEAQLGNTYRFHVSSLQHRSQQGTTTIKGEITAWNTHEIVRYPFQWQE